MAPLYAWKFLVGSTPVQIPGDAWAAANCVAVVVATDEETARARLKHWAGEQGLDPRWLGAATVKRLELAAGAVLAWAEV